MRLHKLITENVKGLKHIELSFNGGVTKLSGANGAGKTSIADSIKWLIGGATVIDEKPIRNGEEQATLRGWLGNEEVEYIVTRTFRVDGDSFKTDLKIETPQGAKWSGPQAILDKLGAARSCDPQEMAEKAIKSPKDFRRSLLRLLGLEVTVDELEAANQGDYDNRTLVNRDLKQKQAQLAAMPEGKPDLQPVDVSAVMQEIRAAQEHNQAVQERQRRLDSGMGRLKMVRNSIADLEIQLAALRTEEHELASSFTTFEVGEAKDTAPFQQRIMDAQNINAEISRVSRRAELVTAVELLEHEADTLTARIAVREKEKTLLLTSAELPIKGLGVTDDTVTFNDVPIKQLSQGELIVLFASIAMRTNPELKLLWIKNASLLDNAAQASVAQWADENGYDVILEYVDETGTVGIYLQGGEVAVNNYAAKKAKKVAV